jgi:hypothetical protein
VLDAVAADDPPYGLGQLGTPLRVIDDPGHSRFLAQAC